ncbi:hypothetical protein [Aequorivita echinoideorum]|uniref:Uncharacterized protein n=1 Tax=Aequorivita echinoideorum TaxID=1549647 RepID=A0ABS5S5C5_9FLAO|nr:hypothetical protein [Aequorivita echinoideorum]MBT0607620.1 hypothetical protein [Aequorivita echinoideorum]
MKITLQTKSSDDLGPIANAGEHYAKTLERLIYLQNKSAQHVHKSILDEFRYSLLKKLINPNKPKAPKIKMELHTAFVLKDAFQNYSQSLNEEKYVREAAQLRRLTMELYSLLPRTEDQEEFSLNSKI